MFNDAFLLFLVQKIYLRAGCGVFGFFWESRKQLCTLSMAATEPGHYMLWKPDTGPSIMAPMSPQPCVEYTILGRFFPLLFLSLLVLLRVFILPGTTIGGWVGHSLHTLSATTLL
jgi:hypothetical protein